jgi:hypothetical protein
MDPPKILKSYPNGAGVSTPGFTVLFEIPDASSARARSAGVARSLETASDGAGFYAPD